MPDPTPFLLARKSASPHLIKERPSSSPIASDRSAGGLSPATAREAQHKAHVGVAHPHPPCGPAGPPRWKHGGGPGEDGGKVVRKHSGMDRTV